MKHEKAPPPPEGCCAWRVGFFNKVTKGDLVFHLALIANFPSFSSQSARKRKRRSIRDSIFGTLLTRANPLISPRSMSLSELRGRSNRAPKWFNFCLSKNIHSKARLQAISYICKPEYLKTVNFETQTGDLVKILKEMAQVEWFESQSASWNKLYGAPFALRLTPFGFCFTFNIINDTDLMFMDEWEIEFSKAFPRQENFSFSLAESRKTSRTAGTFCSTKRKSTRFWWSLVKGWTTWRVSRGVRRFLTRTADSTLLFARITIPVTGGVRSTKAFAISFMAPTSFSRQPIDFSCSSENSLSC